MAETRKIANFELIERIGQGGMGTVFKARQISMDRVVALKVLPPSLARQKKFIERFVREARASARLNHPNIVNGIDVGHDNGLYYFAMEFVEGENLKDSIKKSRLSEERVIEIGRAIALALAHAHANGILHRDIKPDNILIDSSRTPKLCDLGLARLDNEREDEKNLTQQGQAVGTPHYISPEQARGEGNLTAATDLYSLGATLYHALTGATPFDGVTSVVVMTKHITDKVPHPSELGVQLSKNMIAVLAKLLTKDRNDRYQSAQNLADDLGRLAAGKPPQNADLPASKWPFTGSAPGMGTVKKSPATVTVNEKARHNRREARSSQPRAMQLIAPLLLLVLAAGAAYGYVLNKKKAPAVPLASNEPPRDDGNSKRTAAVPPRAEPVKTPESRPVSTRVAPTAEPVGFKKPVDPMVRVAPQAEAVGFKTPMMAPGSKTQAPVHENSDSATAEKKPEPVKPAEPAPDAFVLPDIKAPPPEKIQPGSEVAALMAKALVLSADTRFKDAAAVFNLPTSKLEALDEFDRECVKVHIDGYLGLAEMKQTVLERLKHDVNKVDASKIFTKKMIGTITGGDDAKLTIKGPSFEMQWNWQKLSLEELQNLSNAVLGSMSQTASVGCGVICYTRNDDSLAKKFVAGVTHSSARKLLEFIDLRDKATIARKIAEKNDAATKLYAEIEAAIAEGNLKAAVTKATVLRVVYADTDKAKEVAEKMNTFVEAAKLAIKTNSAIVDGNVALSANGAKIYGGLREDEVIDGITTGYTGSTGFGTVAFNGEMTITLPKTYLLREIRLLLWDVNETRFYRYVMETSADGESFTVLEDHSRGEWRSWQTLSFTPRPVKSIRFRGLYNSSIAGVHVVEIEAYCKPPEKPAIPRAPSVPPDMAADKSK
ncbi:MAG TPA: protein kinase [Planctomycetota bacterium]|nr:protein kinase [Planctomycetota bacterium]